MGSPLSSWGFRCSPPHPPCIGQKVPHEFLELEDSGHTSSTSGSEGRASSTPWEGEFGPVLKTRPGVRASSSDIHPGLAGHLASGFFLSASLQRPELPCSVPWPQQGPVGCRIVSAVTHKESLICISFSSYYRAAG